MSATFARFFSLLTSLEREYGLSSLDVSSRAVFDFIVQRQADGTHPSADDVLAANIVSRATAYRRLTALRDSGLIEAKIEGGRTVYSVSARLNGFGSDVARLLRRAAPDDRRALHE